MFIQTQDTPNPSVIKFLPGQAVWPAGALDFSNASTAANSPLAQRLFAITGVNGVFLGEDFVSVTKADDTDWNMLKPMVLTAIMEHLATNQPIVIEGSDESQSSADQAEEDDSLVVQIKLLLDERVRPAVAQDGGDIVFDSFEDGVVYLHMRGACAGCPSSTMTLKSGIENMLRHYVPEVTEVRAVEY